MRRKAHVRFGGGSGETGQTKGRYRALLLPNPWPPGAEPQGDPRVEAIAEAAREQVRLRDEWLAGKVRLTFR